MSNVQKSCGSPTTLAPWARACKYFNYIISSYLIKHIHLPHFRSNFLCLSISQFTLLPASHFNFLLLFSFLPRYASVRHGFQVPSMPSHFLSQSILASLSLPKFQVPTSSLFLEHFPSSSSPPPIISLILKWYAELQWESLYFPDFQCSVRPVNLWICHWIGGAHIRWGIASAFYVMIP